MKNLLIISLLILTACTNSHEQIKSEIKVEKINRMEGDFNWINIQVNFTTPPEFTAANTPKSPRDIVAGDPAVPTTGQNDALITYLDNQSNVNGVEYSNLVANRTQYILYLRDSSGNIMYSVQPGQVVFCETFTEPTVLATGISNLLIRKTNRYLDIFEN